MSWREIPGSAFETGDSEDRTWDEMGVGRGLVDDDDDYLDEQDSDEVDPRDAERDSAWADVRSMEAQIAVLSSRVPAKPDAVAYSFDPDVDGLDTLRAELADVIDEYGRPPIAWIAPAKAPTPPPAPIPSRPRLRDLASYLEDHLSSGELRHWRWLAAGKDQTWIADQLAVSQAAVSKREQKLRARVDGLHIARFGKPYPWASFSRSKGGRPRRL